MQGPFTVDRFANVKNKQIERFNSLFWNPGSEAVDCFTQDWSNENNWQSSFLVIPTIKHLIQCKAKGTLVVPKWPSAALWPFIFKSNLEYQKYVRDVLEFKDSKEIYVQGENKNSIFGTDKFHASVLVVRLDGEHRN